MRLDNYLVEKNILDSRTKAKQAILRGEIYINGVAINKPAYDIDENSTCEVSYNYVDKFVSLGGYKLNKAINDFNLNVENLIVADVGASTGGFTDCLLTKGAKKVFAIDLNDTLLHQKLKNDNRVVSLIKNARDLTKGDFDSQLDLIVADLSFISATLVLNIFSQLLSNGKKLIILVKPQFETGLKKKFKNGIIRDAKVQNDALVKVVDCAKEFGFSLVDKTTAPICEDKNLEFLILLEKI